MCFLLRWIRAGLWCVLICLSCGQNAAAQDWLSWRGSQHQGRFSSPYTPTEWSPTHNIRWSVAIRGRGHSSPVVANGRVYLTTAYVAEAKRPWHTLTEGMILLSALLTAWLALAFLVRAADHCCEKNTSPSPNHLTAFALAVALLFLLLFFSPKLFNLERCNIRTWLVSTAFVSLCLMAASFGLPAASRTRAALGGAAIAFAAWVALAVPSKDHAYGGGLFGPATTVLLFTAAIPLAVGLYQVGKWWAARMLPSASKTLSHRQTVSLRWKRFLPVGIGAAVLVSALALVLHAGVFSTWLRSDPRLIAPVELPTLVRGRIVALFAAACVICLVLRRFCLPHRLLILLSVFSSVGLIATGSVKLMEALAQRSPYLTYHIDQPTLETTLPPFASWLFVLLCLCCLLFTFRHCRNHPQSTVCLLPTVFRVSVLMIGVLTFVYANYLTTAQVFVRAVMCLNAANGSTYWIREALPEPQGQLDRHNTPATPTPAIMNNRVYAYFGSTGLICLDLEGNLRWTRKDLPFVSDYGSASSPIAANGRVFVVSDVDKGTSHLWAMDGETGKTMWSHEWAAEGGMGSGNNRTPEVKLLGGREVLLVWGKNWLAGFDTASGQKLWRQTLALSPYDVVASSISDEARIYLSGGSEAHAYRLDAASPNGFPLAWKNRDTGINCVSPLLVNGLLFLMEDGGLLSCIEAQSGKTLWQQELEGQFFASPVGNEHAVYVTNSEGVTTVVACARQFRKLAENRLDEGVYASFAPSGNCLLIRTEQHLHCVGQ